MTKQEQINKLWERYDTLAKIIDMHDDLLFRTKNAKIQECCIQSSRYFRVKLHEVEDEINELEGWTN